MKRLLRGLLAGLRECLKPTWEHPDETDLEADAAARAEWVRKHRHQHICACCGQTGGTCSGGES